MNLKQDFNPEGYEGFVYYVFYKDRLVYIGKKSFFSTTSVLPKGKKKRVYTKKPSKWQRYTGSNKALNELYAVDPSKFTFSVMWLCKTKIDLTYYEIKEQMRFDAILGPQFYNDNILGKFYRGRVGYAESP